MHKRSFPVGEFVFCFQDSKNVVFCTQPITYVSLSADWMGTGSESVWETPASLVGQGSGGCVCGGVSRHQQISSPPSAAIPVAICPFRVDNDTKNQNIFDFSSTPPLSPPWVLSGLEGGKGGKCSLSVGTASHYFPSTMLHLFLWLWCKDMRQMFFLCKAFCLIKGLLCLS